MVDALLLLPYRNRLVPLKRRRRSRLGRPHGADAVKPTRYICWPGSVFLPEHCGAYCQCELFKKQVRIRCGDDTCELDTVWQPTLESAEFVWKALVALEKIP